MLKDPSEPRKLILPAVHAEEYPTPLPEYLIHTEQAFRAGRLIQKNQSTLQSGGPLPVQLARLWHRDPAYKVLFVAIGVIVASSIICVALLAGFVARLSPPPASPSTPITSSPHKPQPTPTLLPTVTPLLSATPTIVPTPTAIPTSIAVATPLPIATAPASTAPTPKPAEKLTVQIESLPAQINNNTLVPVLVSTNQPGASVSLFITYNTIPFLDTSEPQTTDANGRATFSWDVHEHPFSPFTRTVTANLTAVMHYQDRPQATSQTVSVRILIKE